MRVRERTSQVTIVTTAPGSFVSRMRVYFAEMFPLQTRTVQIVAYAFSFVFLLSLATRVKQGVFNLPCVIAAIDVLQVTLMLRLMDELKDLDIDRFLFPRRPVPSGRVLTSDIRTSLAIVVAAYVGINVLAPKLLLPALIILVYSFLMFKHFFTRSLHRRSLLLTLASHNPVVALLLLHLSWSFIVASNLELSSATVKAIALCGVMYWCTVASWELSRKIRSAEEETNYVTYSRVLGRCNAVFATATLQTAACGIGLHLAHTMSASPVYYLILLTGYVVVLASHLWFLVNPSKRTNRLRTATELFAGSVFLAQFVEYVLQLLMGVDHA